ncbi:hypothetical protein Emed_006800 [Eimeria media]
MLPSRCSVLSIRGGPEARVGLVEAEGKEAAAAAARTASPAAAITAAAVDREFAFLQLRPRRQPFCPQQQQPHNLTQQQQQQDLQQQQQHPCLPHHQLPEAAAAVTAALPNNTSAAQAAARSSRGTDSSSKRATARGRCIHFCCFQLPLSLQVMGTKGKRFYKIVAANQRDPRDGKHMECSLSPLLPRVFCVCCCVRASLPLLLMSFGLMYLAVLLPLVSACYCLSHCCCCSLPFLMVLLSLVSQASLFLSGTPRASVLGTYVPIPASSPSTSELRLRFSRVKFWLGVGASFPESVGRLLGSAGLIPSPPPLYGWRCRGRYHELLQQQQQQQQMLRVSGDPSSVKCTPAPAAACDACCLWLLRLLPLHLLPLLLLSLPLMSVIGELLLTLWLKQLQQQLQQHLLVIQQLLQQQLLFIQQLLQQ